MFSRQSFLCRERSGKTEFEFLAVMVMTKVTNKTQAVIKETLYYDGGGIYGNNDFPGLNYRK